MTIELERIYQAFDPAPLEADQVSLYVDLDFVRGASGTVDALAQRIRLSNSPTCQIITGHRGSGKTTELKRLQHGLESGDKKFFVVFCEADEDIDRNDIDFPDVLVAIMRQLAGQLKERVGIELKAGYFRDRFERVKHLLGSSVDIESLVLEAGMRQLSASIKSSPDARLEIRKLLEPDTGNLLHAANDVLGKAVLELSRGGYHGLVIIVDDLDKMVLRSHAAAGCSTGEYLFVHREAQLTAFKCHMIYTLPIALAYAAPASTIASLYGGSVPVIPMTKVTHRPPSKEPYQPGMKKFRELIATRLAEAGVSEKEIFKSRTIQDRLITLSGGQPRELINFIREALISGDLPIKDGAVKRVARQARRTYERQLREQHRPILRQAKSKGRFKRTKANDEAIRELLESRALLQYSNDDEWYGVNPVIAGIKNST